MSTLQTGVSYKSVLKELVQAAVALRPEQWSGGLLQVERTDNRLVCRFLHPETGQRIPVNEAIVRGAHRLNEALFEVHKDWERCQIRFDRKGEGWGIRVKLSPSVPQVSVSHEVHRELPVLANSEPSGHESLYATSTSLQNLMENTLNGSLMASGQSRFDMTTDIDAVQGMVKTSDTMVIGIDFSVKITSPETLVYSTDQGEVPVYISNDYAQNVSYVHISRVTSIDAPFGQRIISPHEHAAMARNLRAALSLFPNKNYEIV